MMKESLASLPAAERILLDATQKKAASAPASARSGWRRGAAMCGRVVQAADPTLYTHVVGARARDSERTPHNLPSFR